MCQHHALRKTGCARGVNQGRNPLRDFGVDWLWLRFLIQRTDCDLAYTRRLVDHRGTPFRVFPGLWRYAGSVNDATSSAVLLDRIHLAGRETGIDQYGPGVHG